jgi:diaminopimelate decarboxylase
MHHFNYRDDQLYCEDVALCDLVGAVGTPCYVYSQATLQHHFTIFDQAFESVPHLTCFALKANCNLAVINLFGQLGGGADIVSGGELFRALKAGIPAERIVYSGVGKSLAEIDYALKNDILMFNIESSQELETINARAALLGCRARIALRVNPDVDPKTHPYISTGMKTAKFGIDIDSAMEEYRRAQTLGHVEILGVSCHIGSQLTDVAPFVDALRRLQILIDRLKDHEINIRYLDFGGGLGITYDQEEPPHPRQYAQNILQELGDLRVTLIFEPGRVIVGNAGILVTRVLYTKKTASKNFVIVDAAMNDLLRPSLYGSYHHIQPLKLVAGTGTEVVDVVGPICESGDFLARDRELPLVQPGEHVAVMSAGAYGSTMASNYNSRPRPAEVLVKGTTFRIVRQRETWDDLVRGESF